MTIGAAVSHAPYLPFSLKAVDLQGLGPGEVLVRMVATGFSHTEVASRDGIPGQPFSSIFGQSSFASHTFASERNTVEAPRDSYLVMIGPLGCGIETGAGLAEPCYS